MPARPLRALLLAAVALAVPAARPADASLDLSILTSTANAGGTGSFDVLISSSGGSFDVSGFSFNLQVASNSGILFTGVTAGTVSAPYIFGTLQSSPFSSNTFPTTRFIASDSSLSAPFTVTVGPGSTFGLGRVSYSVAAGTAPGPIAVSFLGTTGLNRTTEVNDINGDPFAITATGGTITVAGAGSVPEPASAVLVATGLAGAGLIAARRARRRA